MTSKAGPFSPKLLNLIFQLRKLRPRDKHQDQNWIGSVLPHPLWHLFACVFAQSLWRSAVPLAHNTAEQLFLSHQEAGPRLGGGRCREQSRFALAADQRGGGSQHLDLAEFLSWHMGSGGASCSGPRSPTSRGVCCTDQMAPKSV